MPGPDVVDQIIVGFDRKLSQFGHIGALQRIDDALRRLQSDFGATVLDRFVTPDKAPFFAIAIITLEGTTLDELRQTIEKEAAFDAIGWVERNAPIAPATFNDPLFAQQWALRKLGATAPWTVNPPAGNGKTIVAIVDSGLRRPDGSVHADLGYVEPANVCQPPGFFPHCRDDDGHGTLLAGTIAAVPGNHVGISSATEPTWNISLLPVKFFSPARPPNAAFAAFAIVHAAYALSQPSQRKVINLSWHVAPGGGLITLRTALDIAVNTLGCLVVFAAGNDGTDNETFPLYPANFGSTYGPISGKGLTAIATDRYDAKASFSNYGAATADLGAPGLRILSTGRYLVNPPRYASYSGTSPAAAYVSAGAALVFSLNPQNWDGANASAWTAADVRQHLLASADTIEDLKLACIGGKRLNLHRAVYGPLRITAPVRGNTLHVGVPTTITWTNTYTNPAFTHVKIEFSKDDGATYAAAPISASTANNGSRNWTPNAGQTTATGRIRITPTAGNFPKVSGQFRVV